MLRADHPLTEPERQALWALLPPERRERLERLHRSEKRDEVLWAYGLLALALRERYGWESLPAVAPGVRGKPCFPEHPHVQFSLSHTEGAVLVGIAEVPVGVDLEKLRPVSPRLMEQTGAETQETFWPLWVRREARGKCRGTGIGPMLRGEPPMEAEEVYVPLETFPGYAAGAAVMGGTGAPKVHLRTPEDLLK